MVRVVEVAWQWQEEESLVTASPPPLPNFFHHTHFAPNTHTHCLANGLLYYVCYITVSVATPPYNTVINCVFSK